nr:hypothetical protein [Tanacetum cinerariifolium]
MESDNVVSKIDTGDQDEGQTRPNPESTDASTQQNPEQMDEEFTITTYPNVQENLKLPFEDPFFVEKQQEKEPGKTNAEAEAQSMVSVLIHQDTSSVPPMTTPVIGLTTSQSVSPLPTSTTTTLIITTTTSLLPPPQQITADPTLVKHIGKLEKYMANLLQYNLALEESDLPTVDMKEILQQRMFKDKSYEAHEDHKNLNSFWVSTVIATTSTSSSRRIWCSRYFRSIRIFLVSLPPPLSSTGTSRSAQKQGSKASKLSPTDSLIQDDSIPDEQVYLSDDEHSGNDYLPKADSRKDWWKPLPEEEKPVTPKHAWIIPSSNVLNVENTGLLCYVTIQTQFFFNKDLKYLRYGSKGSSLALSISKMKAASYPNFGRELLVPEQIHDSLSRQKEVRSHMRILSVVRIKAYSRYVYDYLSEIVLRRVHLQEHTIFEKDFKNLYLSDFEDQNLLLLQGHLDHLPGSDKRMLSTTVKLWTQNLVIRQRVEDFQLGIESNQT